MKTKNTIICIVPLLLILCIQNIKSYAQREADNWYFGDHAGINFSTCNPVAIYNGQLNTVEGVSTISDSNGMLLFYTDGNIVWNKQHLVMQNGTGLFGHFSSSQSAVIVPQPGNDSIYFIFTNDMEYSFNGLNYSIVNIKHNGGLGEVIVKNLHLLTDGFEKLIAVRHFNKNDIWVITRQFGSDKYYTWAVTASGVSATPVISNSGNYIGSPINTSRGYLKISTDGKRLVSAYNKYLFLEFSDFNNQTGVISNTFKINSQPPTIGWQGEASPYGVEFSPDNKYLYTTTRFDISSTGGYNYYIHQYDVSIYDSASISNSVIPIDSGGTVINPTGYIYGAIQLAKNGKIYVTQYNTNKLGVINNPNALGLACSFQTNAVNLGSGLSKIGLPTFIQSYFEPAINDYNFTYTYVGNCINNNVQFSFLTNTPYDSIKWDFGDYLTGGNNFSSGLNPIHNYISSGFYSVKLFIYSKNIGCPKTDTIVKQIFAGGFSYSLGNDTAICTKDTLLLNATVSGATSYVWNTGAVTPTIKTYQTNIYWCDVNKGGCVYRDSIDVLVKPLPTVNLGKDTTLCEDNTLLLNVTNPPTSSYLWQDARTTATYLVTQTGQYNARVIMNGCVNRDTVNIDYFLKPRFTLGANRPICTGMSFILDPKIDSVNYLWQDGSNNKTYTVTQPGLYRLTAINYCGSTTDAVVVTQGACKLYIPNAFTPNGDGKNDVFRASYGENVTDYQLQIYNRYGQIIFTSNEINKGWDGTYKGSKQPIGSYAWIIAYKTATNNTEAILKGTILLIR